MKLTIMVTVVGITMLQFHINCLDSPRNTPRHDQYAMVQYIFSTYTGCPWSVLVHLWWFTTQLQPLVSHMRVSSAGNTCSFGSSGKGHSSNLNGAMVGESISKNPGSRAIPDDRLAPNAQSRACRSIVRYWQRYHFKAPHLILTRDNCIYIQTTLQQDRIVGQQGGDLVPASGFLEIWRESLNWAGGGCLRTILGSTWKPPAWEMANGKLGR
jgi:hypothetical protein